MAGALVPPWYKQMVPGRSEILLVTFLWGFTMALGIFTCAKAVRQTRRSWARRHRWNAYIIMVWLSWVCSIAIGVTYWLFIVGHIEPR